VKPTTELPDDPALPALAAIRTAGLAGVLPALGLESHPVELVLCGYSPGSRATLEARAGPRRFAVKAYAEDPAPEAALYEELAAAGLAGDSGARVPPLLAWNRDLKLLVIGWLEGRDANELVKDGWGVRAGELAACWLKRVASLCLTLGAPLGADRLLDKINRSLAVLSDADPALGHAARALAARLERTQPPGHPAHLVHGTFYARHVLDLGDGPGVIDWQRFGQGPLELDAGMFLATLSRQRFRHEPSADEAARASEAFLAATRGLFDMRALAWYHAAALLKLARRLLKRQPPPEACLLLEGAERLAEFDSLYSVVNWTSLLLEEAARLAEAAV
jgi:hypothetical protein